MKRLQQKIFITGTIKLLTGLHIGGSNSHMGIGGPDNLVIRNPISQMPMIPGSSLKGKMRALLELSKGLYHDGSGRGTLGEVGNAPEIVQLFGSSADDRNQNSHASRLVVRDAEMIEEDDERWNNTDMLYTEAKTEVTINRLTSKANPRTFERVPAGASFGFEMVINVVSKDDEAHECAHKLCSLLAEGMELLQDDYLGGQGSRGYGKIRFTELNFDSKTYPGGNRSELSEELKNCFSKLTI
ncbi:MAG: type III-A CRISPR-associated RAMP protein Csm3 [Bacteroidales bacterium]